MDVYETQQLCVPRFYSSFIHYKSICKKSNINAINEMFTGGMLFFVLKHLSNKGIQF